MEVIVPSIGSLLKEVIVARATTGQVCTGS